MTVMTFLHWNITEHQNIHNNDSDDPRTFLHCKLTEHIDTHGKCMWQSTLKTYWASRQTRQMVVANREHVYTENCTEHRNTLNIIHLISMRPGTTSTS